METPAPTDLPRCPKCDSNRVDLVKFGSPRGWKAVCFVVFAVCYLTATLIAMVVEMRMLPSESPDWLTSVSHYLADTGLGRLVLLGAVGLVIFAYLCLEGNVDALGGLQRILGSSEQHCRLCGYRWQAKRLDESR